MWSAAEGDVKQASLQERLGAIGFYRTVGRLDVTTVSFKCWSSEMCELVSGIIHEAFSIEMFPAHK